MLQCYIGHTAIVVLACTAMYSMKTSDYRGLVSCIYSSIFRNFNPLSAFVEFIFYPTARIFLLELNFTNFANGKLAKFKYVHVNFNENIYKNHLKTKISEKFIPQI